MINKTLLSPNELITLLWQLQNEKFIFRGHSSGKYILQPSVFRKDSLIKLAENYPENANVQKWMDSEAVNHTINAWTKGMRPVYLSQIFNYILHLMRYNYALQHFYLVKEHTDKNDQRLLTIFPDGHWAKQDTFERLFEFVYGRFVYLEDLKGNPLKEPYYMEESTGFDQSWAQHYEFHTALLDWSYNPLVAIYFSLGSTLVETKKSERMLYTTSEIPPTHLSIFAYKEIGSVDSSPIKIIPGSSTKTNIRLAHQEGTFTYFNDAFRFFLMNGKFPSIEAYNCEKFELIRFNIERTPANLHVLKTYIEDHGICDIGADFWTKKGSF